VLVKVARELCLTKVGLEVSMRNLYSSRSKYPALQGAASAAASLLEQVNFVPNQKNGEFTNR
jgi:hypothetical protein